MTRSHVYDMIDDERAYQIDQASDPDRPDMIPVLSVGDTLSAINTLMHQAQHQWYYDSGDHPETMKLLRKIAALAVQAGENFGMPER